MGIGPSVRRGPPGLIDGATQPVSTPSTARIDAIGRSPRRMMTPYPCADAGAVALLSRTVPGRVPLHEMPACPTPPSRSRLSEPDPSNPTLRPRLSDPACPIALSRSRLSEPDPSNPTLRPRGPDRDSPNPTLPTRLSRRPAQTGTPRSLPPGAVPGPRRPASSRCQFDRRSAGSAAQQWLPHR